MELKPVVHNIFDYGVIFNMKDVGVWYTPLTPKIRLRDPGCRI